MDYFRDRTVGRRLYRTLFLLRHKGDGTTRGELCIYMGDTLSSVPSPSHIFLGLLSSLLCALCRLHLTPIACCHWFHGGAHVHSTDGKRYWEGVSLSEQTMEIGRPRSLSCELVST